jgi:N-acyl homoserine lactone hydrolase
MREKSKVKRMFILDGGSISYDVGMMKYGTDLDKKTRVATPFYAFDTEEGWVLFDTGWPKGASPLLEMLGYEPDIQEFNTADEQIKKLGLKTSDISKIIISHMHVDHTGGLQYFPDAEVYVQKDEYAYANHPNSFQATPYVADTFNMPGIKWRFLEGDDVILPGLTVIMAGGHTPGLQALIVEVPQSGFYILGGDSAYLRENIEKNIPPGSAWNPVIGQYSIKRLKAIQKLLDAQFFPGHEFAFFKENVKTDEAYV